MSLEAFQNIKYTQKYKTSTKNKQPSNPIHSCQVIVNDDRQINEFAGVSFRFISVVKLKNH